MKIPLLSLFCHLVVNRFQGIVAVRDPVIAYGQRGLSPSPAFPVVAFLKTVLESGQRPVDQAENNKEQGKRPDVNTRFFHSYFFIISVTFFGSLSNTVFVGSLSSHTFSTPSGSALFDLFVVHKAWVPISQARHPDESLLVGHPRVSWKSFEIGDLFQRGHETGFPCRIFCPHTR